MEHDNLLVKLEHYGIRGLVSNRKQYVSINGHESNLASVLYGVPKGINDLNQAIKFCKVHHFANDTNLLHLNKSVAKPSTLVNQDMENLTKWLNANH